MDHTMRKTLAINDFEQVIWERTNPSAVHFINPHIIIELHQKKFYGFTNVAQASLCLRSFCYSQEIDLYNDDVTNHIRTIWINDFLSERTDYHDIGGASQYKLIWFYKTHGNNLIKMLEKHSCGNLIKVDYAI